MCGAEALTSDDTACLDALAYGVRLAAKVVDIPCADMHTDSFLDVSLLLSSEMFRLLFLKI